jgi:phytoene synthase
MIRGGSRSFFLASLLLPDEVREGAYALYAFCRLSDDAVDVEGGRLDAVGSLRRRLDGIYSGTPEAIAVDRALADTVTRFVIPRTALDALLEGLEWDARGRDYETLCDLRAYAARVAGSVGIMMASLMDARTPELAARACDLGVAMQLTNIARDVGEDARAGRLYLPRAWLRDAGLDPDAWLADPVFRPEIAEAVARLLRHADELYERADLGIAGLSVAFRPAIFAARHLYAEIGARLARRGLDSISRRETVPVGRKIVLVGRSVVRAMGASGGAALGAPLAETAFLVEALERETPAPAAPLSVRRRRRGIAADAEWVMDLFAALEWRGRLRGSAP